MQTTSIINSGIKTAFIVVAILAALGTTQKDVSAASPDNTPDLMIGITYDKSLSPEDVAYLENSLQLLHDQLPEWWQYVQEAQPFTLVIDTHEGSQGREAIAKCCDPQGRGAITIGHRLGHSLDADDTAEAQQVLFVGTFIHELTHVRDQREGRFTAKTDFKSCVAAEKSGLEKQLEVKRAMASAGLGENYQRPLNQQIGNEASALKSRELWNLYCGAFDN